MLHDVDRAIDLMKRQRFVEALPLLRRTLDRDPSQWNAWYMAGQCCRFLNDMDGATLYLSRAAELNGDEPSIFLALGIAFQKSGRLEDAVKVFRRAIEIDRDNELAYNSLALTQKLCGELDNALHNYEAGAEALARRIVRAFRNSRTSTILKHDDTTGQLWSGYAAYGAIYLTSCADGIDHFAWPTGEQAIEEERTEQHAGLYWEDTRTNNGRICRLFLPNYFNTFREALKRDASYSNLVGNRGTVLELLGRHDDARQHFEEATDFLPSE